MSSSVIAVRARRSVPYVVASIIALWVLVPLVWLLRIALTRTVGSLVPIVPQWAEVGLSNFVQLFARGDFKYWLINSFVFAGGVAVLNAVLSPAIGYVLARRRIRGANAFLLVILLGWIVPLEVTLLPLYLGLAKVGLVNTYIGLILPLGLNPLSVFIMRQFMISIPDTYEEAAWVDGAGRLTSFFRIVVPLALPAVGAVCIVTFVFTWGSLVYPLVMMSSSARYTLTVGLASLSFGAVADYGLMMAGTLVGALPLMAIFVVFSRQFMSSMTMIGGETG